MNIHNNSTRFGSQSASRFWRDSLARQDYIQNSYAPILSLYNAGDEIEGNPFEAIRRNKIAYAERCLRRDVSTSIKQLFDHFLLNPRPAFRKGTFSKHETRQLKAEWDRQRGHLLAAVTKFNPEDIKNAIDAMRKPQFSYFYQLFQTKMADRRAGKTSGQTAFKKVMRSFKSLIFKECNRLARKKNRTKPAGN